MLFGQLQTAPITGGQQFRFLLLTALPDWANRVNYLFCRQQARCSNHRFTSGTTALSLTYSLTGLQNGRATCAMNRIIYTATAQQTTIGCVDNGINGKMGDIALNQLNFIKTLCWHPITSIQDFLRH
jgi:hypothetical protein